LNGSGFFEQPAEIFRAYIPMSKQPSFTLYKKKNRLPAVFSWPSVGKVIIYFRPFRQ